MRAVGRVARRQVTEGGFTMAELLVTMVLLTISLTGLAGLQITAIKKVTSGKRGAEATRLAENIATRYQTMAFGLLPGALNPPNWETELQKDGTTEMRDVSVDGGGTGPYTVQRMIEDMGGSRKMITVRVSWLDTSVHEGGTSRPTTRNVMVALQRSQ